jgi:hypothetical protein
MTFEKKLLKTSKIVFMYSSPPTYAIIVSSKNIA